MPSPSPFVDRRRFTIRFLTARDGCRGGAGLDGVAAPLAASLLVLAFDVDCVRRRLRVAIVVGESTTADGDVGPKRGPENVVPGERGEQGPSLPLPPLPMLVLLLPMLWLLPAGGDGDVGGV